jgi:hypothetical protein
MLVLVLVLALLAASTLVVCACRPKCKPSNNGLVWHVLVFVTLPD